MPQHPLEPTVSNEILEQSPEPELRTWRAPTVTEIPIVESTQAGFVPIGSDAGIYS
jgi:hypothetical protein